MKSRDLVFRVRKEEAASPAGWLLRIDASVELRPEVAEALFALDDRMPTIGFERLIVVPEDDLRTRIDIMYNLML